MKIILVIDDIPLNGMICEILNSAGYEVRSAPNGVEGLQLFMKVTEDGFDFIH